MIAKTRRTDETTWASELRGIFCRIPGKNRAGKNASRPRSIAIRRPAIPLPVPDCSHRQRSADLLANLVVAHDRFVLDVLRSGATHATLPFILQHEEPFKLRERHEMGVDCREVLPAPEL